MQSEHARFRRRAILALAAAPGFAFGQLEAAKHVRIVVPFLAGGIVDSIARALAGPMTQALGRPVVIENRPGADGIVAADVVAKAPPDGFTLFFGTATALSFAPAAHKTLPYDPVKDFTPIGMICEFGYFLYVHPALPARDVRELVAYARANPSKLNHAYAAASSLLASTVFSRSQQIDIVQIPYKGDAQVAPDLISGRVQLAFASGAHLPHVKQGTLRAVVTTLPVRSSLAPDVPTLAESGIPPLGIKIWGGLLGPAKMSRQTVDKVANALAQSLASPEVRRLAADSVIEIRTSSHEEFAAFVKQQGVAWRAAADAAGIKPE